MATTTTNLGLTKPAQTDFYDVDVFNGNADILDEAIQEIADDLADVGEFKSLGNVTGTYDTVLDALIALGGTSGSFVLEEAEDGVITTGSVCYYCIFSHYNSETDNAAIVYCHDALHGGGAESTAQANVYYRYLKNHAWISDWVKLLDTAAPVPVANGGTGTSNGRSGVTFQNTGNNSVNIDTDFTWNYVAAISNENHGTIPSSGGVWWNVVNFYSTHFITQLAMRVVDSTEADRNVRMFVRERYMNGSSAWSQWREIATQSSLADMMDPMLPLAGGTMTGDIIMQGNKIKYNIAGQTYLSLWGTDIAGLETTNTVDIGSSYGVSFTNTSSTGAVEQGTPAVSISTKTGNLFVKGDVYVYGDVKNQDGSNYVQSLLQSGGVSVVKSVQRGTVPTQELTMSDADFSGLYYVDVTITAVNVNKAFVIVNTANAISDGGSRFPCARLVNSTTLRVYANGRTSVGSKQLHDYCWQVVEYY